MYDDDDVGLIRAWEEDSVKDCLDVKLQFHDNKQRRGSSRE